MAALTDEEFEAELRRRLNYPVSRLMVHICGTHVNEQCQLHMTEYSHAWGCPGQLHEILSLLACVHSSSGRMVTRILERYCQDNGLNLQEQLATLNEFITNLATDDNVLACSMVYAELGKRVHGTDDRPQEKIV